MNGSIRFQKRWIFIVGFVITAAVIFFYYRSQKSDLIRPRRGDIVESIYGLGTVVSDTVYRARIGVNLTVKKLFVKEGDAVMAGASLVQLDETLIRSPISGTVSEVQFKTGEMAPAQATLVTVVNLQSLYLEVSLEQQSVLRVRKGQEVAVAFENIRNQKLSGKVSSVFSRQNQFIVKIEIPSWPPGVLPGMTADTAILVGKTSQALLIPLKSIVGGQVVRVRDGKKSKVSVKLDTIDGEWGELVSGDILETDELLIRR